MEEAVQKKYLKCKYKVKKWESEFKEAHRVNPSKTDIKNAPSHIKEAYKTYWKLKTISLETSLVDVSFEDEETMDGFHLPAQDQSDASIKESSLLIKEDSSFAGNVIKEKITQSDEPSTHDTESLHDSLVENQKNVEERSNLLNQSESNDSKSKSSVWGAHLSNEKKVEETPKLESHTLSRRYTEKLFAGATFKKRNPRKSFVRREKSENSIFQLDNSQSTLPSDFEHSFSQPETIQHKTDTTDGEVQNPPDNDLQNFGVHGCNFKIIGTPQSRNMSQPVSLLQNSLESNTMTKPLGNRIIDKGWLERLDKVTNIEKVTMNKVNSSDSGIELTDSSADPKSSPPCATISRSGDVSDDEDFVCDSDSEGERTNSFSSFSSLTKTNSFSRLLSASNSNIKQKGFEPSPLVQSSTKQPQASRTDKRSIDQIDTEVVVSDCKKIRVDTKVLKNTSFADLEIKQQSHFTSRTIPNASSKIETSENQLNKLMEIQNKIPETKDTKLKEILRKKVSSGKANANFVKININKKNYVRGKKTMTFQKYKKQKWKEMKNKRSVSGENGVYKCFKCGDVGHFAKNCMKACDKLLPVEDLEEEEESPFPSLQEAEEMAQEASKMLCVRRNLNELPVHVANQSVDINELASPPLPQSDDIMRFIQQENIFRLNEDGSLIDTPLLVLDTLVKFGHEQWRPGQETAVMRVLSGLSTLVTLSTGSGKSLCYQLPAYLYHTLQQRITIVVSPLVSLMEDQVFCVPSCLRIACLHTNQSPKAREAVYAQLKENSLHALLLSPESLSISERVTELLRSLPPVAFACIDEAHCISQWSHNFRPSYLMVCQVLREKLGVKTILGLTATATFSTISSVSTTLGLTDGVAGVIRDTPLPDNLRLSVSCDREKDLALVELLHGSRFSQCNSIIVYCTRRDECERLAALIRTFFQDASKEDGKVKQRKLSWNAEAYHAGLTAARRRSVQKAFISGKTRIVVATVAFGMGINKQDIKGIIHYNMPSAFERYVQEVGRAGRNGEEANCHLFLNKEGADLNELRRHIYADAVDRHTIRKLLQRVFPKCTCGEECPSHEVAFSIDDTVAELDLPEENITTLLCYLELHARQWVHVCSRAYTRCRVLSYKGPKLIRQAAKECPPLAVAVALEAQKGTKLDKTTKLEFNIFPVASAIKWDSGIVKRQLKNLEWTKVNDQPRRSGLTVDFFDLGFRMQAPGNLSGEELDHALDSLYSRVQAQEETALRQLQAIFHILTEVAHKSVKDCLDHVDNERCEKLKGNIRQYFTEENYLDSHKLPQVKLYNEEQVVADIRSLICCYREVSFTGRAVARIFHGIASPNYPAQQWGRCRFWRSHLHEDFNLISKLAIRELIFMR